MTRMLWFCTGGVSLLLGAIGAVLPVLPTTPFIILAAFAFSKSSPRLELWLKSHRIFGPMIADWQLHGAIALRYKIIATIMMAAAFGFSLAMSFSAAVLIIQAICLTAAALFVLTRPHGPD